MSGDVHVRFRERLEGRFLGATRLILEGVYSWKKGAVEQIIGLVRRTFPKKTDWDLVSQKDLDIIQT